MKRSLKFKAQALFLALLLLGGCSLFEGCDGYYEFIGNLSIISAQQTYILCVASKYCMDTVAGSTYGEKDAEDWYLNTTAGYAYVRVTKDGGYVDPEFLANMTGVTKFEVKIDTTTSTGEVIDVNMVWDTTTSTPTADGDMVYTGADGTQITGEFDSITYDSDAYPVNGDAVIAITPNTPIFGAFTVALLYSSDASAEGDVGSGGQTNNLGSVRLTANKDAAVGESAYELEYVKNSAGEIITAPATE